MKITFGKTMMNEKSKDFERIDDLETLIKKECEEVLKNPLEKKPAIQCLKNLTTIRETFDGNTRLPYYALGYAHRTEGAIFSKKVRLMDDLVDMEKTYKSLKRWLLFVLIPIVFITVYSLIHIIIGRAISQWFYLLTSGPVTFLIGFFVVMPFLLCDTSEEENEDICTAESILSSSDDDEEIKIRKTLNDLIDFQIDVIDTLFEIEDLNQKERRTQFREFLLISDIINRPTMSTSMIIPLPYWNPQSGCPRGLHKTLVISS
ncbi:hypothetical protein CRE_06919 [Caenorhabditis remanei]|uniref:Uncharacterized protein n=1 Tax=Caenorhabditis remanei TaxID=31234 RepID=E3N6K0_CAERE|nr:hypothetical protein CRE_06919 [Caenorhabditis remanei]